MLAKKGKFGSKKKFFNDKMPFFIHENLKVFHEIGNNVDEHFMNN